MGGWKSIADIRREYGELSLSKETALDSPIEQFQLWFEEVLKYEKNDPTAMTLSTVDKDGLPDARIVLLKGVQDGSFIFYTNYQSAKAQQLNHSAYACLNFYWPELSRQVRIRGKVHRVSQELSDEYFASRPLKSQYSAIASKQSAVIKNRKSLEQNLNELIKKYGQAPVIRPEYWGGYAVLPELFEFWQGRDNRLHDRIQYYLENNQWHKRRLAP
jgi:pyridoxamine 5'-phosphate oxidase